MPARRLLLQPAMTALREDLWFSEQLGHIFGAKVSPLEWRYFVEGGQAGGSTKLCQWRYRAAVCSALQGEGAFLNSNLLTESEVECLNAGVNELDFKGPVL